MAPALSTLGIIHTAISLVAVGAGIAAFARDKRIHPRNGTGALYVVMTVLTCLTGFFIFAHGGFGKPHALGVLTLGVIGFAVAVRSRGLFGRNGPVVEAVLYSLTFFFHMIPAVTETFTRVPSAAPLFADAEDPALKAVIGVIFVVFVLGAVLQVRYLRRSLNAQQPGDASIWGVGA